MILSIVNDIEEFMKPIQKFINNNHNNPIFWIAIIGVVLGIFAIACILLHKGK